jgi:eukaryotic-like serine/threonine-protein kinase
LSLWTRLRQRWSAPGRGDDPVAAPPEQRRPAPPVDDVAEIARARADEPASVERALEAIADARGTPRERAALGAALELRVAAAPPEPVLVAAAELLVERGDSASALDLLQPLRSTSALVLSADICAGRGELGRAITLAERALARDIDAPGVRERHARWRAKLGLDAAPSAEPAPTLLRPDLPATSFTIIGEAGRGGAGVVYEAVDDVLGRRVALKVYHRSSERDKLEREARFAIALVGRGVVRVFDANPERGWIAMEWLPGGSLKHWLARAELDVLWPIDRWIVPLARALERVHARGLVHADLKPANVLFRSAREPVISDFGLACRAGERAPGGSVGYLSPERVLGAVLTPADDVYALGRLVEDALAAIDRAPAGLRPAAREQSAWRRAATMATAERDARPADASGFLLSINRSRSHA